MHFKLALATLAVIIGNDFAFAQEVPPTTTAAELWNPWTWFWPYAKASAQGYRDYYEKAQKATNELYQLIEKTNAFPWMTGNWGLSPPFKPEANQNGEQGQNSGGGAGKQPNQNGQNAGGEGGKQPNQNGQNTEGESGKQPNQNGQNTEGESGKQPNQNGQNTEGESGKQPNQEGQNTEDETGGQSNPTEDNQPNSEKPTQEEEITQEGEQNEDKQNEADSTGAQLQGSVQGDGKAEAEVKPQ